MRAFTPSLATGFRASSSEAGGAVAALEGEIVDEGLLHPGQAALFGVALDGPYAFSGEIRRTVDAGLRGAARAVGRVDDHHTGMAYADAAAELRASQAEIVVQEIDHRQHIWHRMGPGLSPVDGHGNFHPLHVTASLEYRRPSPATG